MNAGHAAQTAGIELRELAKSFRTPAGTVHAVRGIDLSIAPGETVALLGPNGAGKSTTVDMVLGLSRPDAGSVSLFGMSPQQAIKSGVIGAMLQSGSLINDLKVWELLDMMASLYLDPLPVDEVIEMTGIAAYRNQLTNKLSGGQTQRVRFACALASDPDLLVLDEPTVAMDVEGRRAFWDTMRGFTTRGKTVVFATHYLEEADDHADRVILMARGRVVADGPPNEIKAKVGSRSIRATLPGVEPARLLVLPGVSSADRRGDAVVLSCGDSDAALRAFLAEYDGARDIEVSGAALEDAFLALTADEKSDSEKSEATR